MVIRPAGLLPGEVTSREFARIQGVPHYSLQSLRFPGAPAEKAGEGECSPSWEREYPGSHGDRFFAASVISWPPHSWATGSLFDFTMRCVLSGTKTCTCPRIRAVNILCRNRLLNDTGPLLEALGVSLRRGGRQAVYRDLSLESPCRGTAGRLKGSNGAGKTSLHTNSLVVSGPLRVSKGQVRSGGQSRYTSDTTPAVKGLLSAA